MNKANADIRNYLSSLNLNLWEIAEWLGMSDASFSRLLRSELSWKEKDRMMSSIKRCAVNKIKRTIEELQEQLKELEDESNTCG